MPGQNTNEDGEKARGEKPSSFEIGKQQYVKSYFSPGQCSSVDGAQTCEPKGSPV